MVRWKARYIRLALGLGAFASFIIASGAGARWS
jgi:hypothetical protein